MVQRLVFFFLWLGLIGYAVWGAPPNQPNTLTLIQHLSTGQWQGINPLVVALFNLMGLWPMIYSAVLLVDGRGQSIRAYPFVMASFLVGAFALLPYLALRRPNPSFTGEKTGVLNLVESRWLGVAIALGTLALLTYGLAFGDWRDFVQQWQTDRFIHVMSLDFCLLCLLFPVVLRDDLARRHRPDHVALWALGALPLVGAVTYLVVRPPLPAEPVASAPANAPTPTP